MKKTKSNQRKLNKTVEKLLDANKLITKIITHDPQIFTAARDRRAAAGAQSRTKRRRYEIDLDNPNTAPTLAEELVNQHGYTLRSAQRTIRILNIGMGTLMQLRWSNITVEGLEALEKIHSSDLNGFVQIVRVISSGADAKTAIQRWQSDRAATHDDFIKRHGEEAEVLGDKIYALAGSKFDTKDQVQGLIKLRDLWPARYALFIKRHGIKVRTGETPVQKKVRREKKNLKDWVRENQKNRYIDRIPEWREKFDTPNKYFDELEQSYADEMKNLPAKLASLQKQQMFHAIQNSREHEYRTTTPQERQFGLDAVYVRMGGELNLSDLKTKASVILFLEFDQSSKLLSPYDLIGFEPLHSHIFTRADGNQTSAVTLLVCVANLSSKTARSLVRNHQPAGEWSDLFNPHEVANDYANQCITTISKVINSDYKFPNSKHTTSIQT